MAVVWKDPILPHITVPEDLKTRTFQLGALRYQLLPAQFQFLSAKEETVAYIGGFGSGKTRVGSLKAILLSMFPGNRGIVGRLASTDLADTAERDLLDMLYEAQLLKEPPNARTRTAIVHCIDPRTGESLGETSEISFQHLDDPKHLRGRHIGWFWIDEASEVDKKAFQNLLSRLRWPSFAGRYQAFVTGNPEGHNWVYDFWFNEEAVSKMICGNPACHLSDKECNKHIRRQRRGIHTTTYENYFLPPDYVEQMVASYTPDERERYLSGSFDLFEGQIYREFSPNIHILSV